MNRHAQALGRMGRGKPKGFTRAEIARRRARMVELNRKRAERRLVAGPGLAPGRAGL